MRCRASWRISSVWQAEFSSRLRQNADIARNTWFGVGGRAEWLFKPESASDLAEFFRVRPQEIPVTVIGVGSNLLIRDGGVRGVVVRLGRGFTGVSGVGCRVSDQHLSLHTPHPTPHTLTLGAACLDVHAAQVAAERGIAGLEFLSGIPGTVGGAVAMNAGAYGREISDVLASVEIVTRAGEIRTLTRAECGFSYRKSALPEGAVVTGAVLCGEAGDSSAISARIAEIQAAREETQPIRSKTGGSTFKNPPGHKAWELIDRAGCRGLTRGGAQVSEKHCNFLINTGSATSADLEGLGEEVRARVKAACDIELEWEIRRIGEP